MQEKWIFSSTFLPYTGEPIEFMLEERNQPIHGTFSNGVFHSRWADYDAERVASWRESEGDRSAMPMGKPKAATTNRFVTTLKRLARALATRNTIPVVPPRSHVRIAVTHVMTKPPIAAATRYIDSNQISS